MPTGTIKTIRGYRGFGFITPDSGRGRSDALFFHASAVDGATFEELQAGQHVTYEQELDPRDPRRQRATRVRPAAE